MTTTARIPYGHAKQTVAAMNVGDVVIVQPDYVVPCRVSARRMGMKLAVTGFKKDGKLIYRMRRIERGWKSGHAACRLPNRDPKTAKWVKDAA